MLGFTKLKSKNKVEASHLLKLKEDPEKRKKKQRRNNEEEEEEGATLRCLRWPMGWVANYCTEVKYYVCLSYYRPK